MKRVLKSIKNKIIFLNNKKHSDFSPKEPYNCLVVPNEIVNSHGTGVLIQKLFHSRENLITIRSHNHYGGTQNFGEKNFYIQYKEKTRKEAISHLLQILGNLSIAKIFCIPFFPEDFLTAYALKTIYNCPMAIYIMDDQFIECPNVPRDFFEKAILASDINFVISPELRDAYERELGKKFYVLPPIVRPREALSQKPPEPEIKTTCKGAIVGSIWNPQWLKQLCNTLKQTNSTLDWYGYYNPSHYQLSFDQLKSAGIYYKGFLDEFYLLQVLKNYHYAVIPMGQYEKEDSWNYITRFSLQTRLSFLVAEAHIPILFVGYEDSPNAKLIKKYNLGVISDYSPSNFSEALSQISSPQNQELFRLNAKKIANNFFLENPEEFIWESLNEKAPITLKFENFFQKETSSLSPFFFTKPNDFPWYLEKDFPPLKIALDTNPKIDLILDVGASNGCWSHYVKNFIFKKTKFILIEPLQEFYLRENSYFKELNPDFQWFPIAAGDDNKISNFYITEDLYNSSFFKPRANQKLKNISVQVHRLDDFVETYFSNCYENILVKIDAQGAETSVVNGCRKILNKICFFYIEISIQPIYKNQHTIKDFILFMSDLNFSVYDFGEEWRCPQKGILLEKHILFINNNYMSIP